MTQPDLAFGLTGQDVRGSDSMVRSLMVMFTLALLAIPAGPAHAQRSAFDSITTPQGRCAVWAPIAGFSNPSDSSYNRCALDSGPTLRPGARMPDPPFAGAYASVSWTLVVNPDGTVEPRLLRPLSFSGDTAFLRAASERILQWRFEPGMRQGQPVRSGFILVLGSDQRNDTLPARMQWTYHQGLNADTLTGKWITEAPLAPFTEAQRDSIYTAMLRHLVQRQVLNPGRDERYCLVMAEGDSAAHARLSRLARPLLTVATGRFRGALGDYGCEKDPRMLRIVLPRTHRTENGRAILWVSGDHLPNHPPGYEGRGWRAWRGRCVGFLPPVGSAHIDCGINPIAAASEIVAQFRQRDGANPRPVGASTGADSMRLTVMAMTRGAFHADTLRTTVRSIPRLSERAITDTVAPCRSSWSVHTTQDSATLFVIAGDIAHRGRLDITQARRTAPPTPPRGTEACGSRLQGPGIFATFLLGNVGDRATSPITLCYSGCARSYVLDPARHTLAEGPHFVLRLADLRPETRLGDVLIYRIILENGPPDVVPLVVYRSTRGSSFSAWAARPLGPGVWDYPVNIDMSDWPGLEVHIYLMTR